MNKRSIAIGIIILVIGIIFYMVSEAYAIHDFTQFLKNTGISLVFTGMAIAMIGSFVKDKDEVIETIPNKKNK